MLQHILLNFSNSWLKIGNTHWFNQHRLRFISDFSKAPEQKDPSETNPFFTFIRDDHHYYVSRRRRRHSFLSVVTSSRRIHPFDVNLVFYKNVASTSTSYRKIYKKNFIYNYLFIFFYFCSSPL